MVATTTGLKSGTDYVCCDLLKNIYLCGSNNNKSFLHYEYKIVVICLKISIFVVATTTHYDFNIGNVSCDLLKNIYLCGSNNNLC